MFTYNFNADQLERMQNLMRTASKSDYTPNEKASQIVDRGLAALELGIKQRTKDKLYRQLGKKVMEENRAEDFAGETLAHFATK